MHLAEELRLPLVTLIDTPGAALSREAEEGGLAGEIARCLHDLVMLKAPDAGGAARARAPAAARWRWCPPTGCWPRPTAGSARCRRRARRRSCTATSTTPARWRRRQGVRATDLWRAGIVDRVVPERPDAADEPTEFCLRLGRVLGEELAGLLGRDDTERFRSRLHRYRHLGR